MQFSLRLVGLLACSLLLPLFSASHGPADIDGADLTCSGYIRQWGSVVSPRGFTHQTVTFAGNFNSENNPTIWIEEAYVHTIDENLPAYQVTRATIYVYVNVDYGEGYTGERLLGSIESCKRGDSSDIALYCSYGGSVGIFFTKEEWATIRRLEIFCKSASFGLASDYEDEYTPNVAFSGRVWLKCDVLPVYEPDAPAEPDLTDVVKEEKRINNSIVNSNSLLTDINSNLRQLAKRDFQVEIDSVEFDTTNVERKLDDINTSTLDVKGDTSSIASSSSDIATYTQHIDDLLTGTGLSIYGVNNAMRNTLATFRRDTSDQLNAVEGAINGIGDSITGAIDGLGDSITGAIDGLGDGINVNVGDVSVETDVSWFQEGEGDTDLGEFETDDVVSRSDYNSLFDPLSRATGGLYLAQRTSSFWNEFDNSSGGTLTLATLPQNMGGSSINLPTWSDIGNLTGGENSGFFSSLPAFIGACIGLIVCLSLFVWIYNLLSK